MEDDQQSDKDEFEITFRFLGNEIIGMGLSSKSKTKTRSLAFFGMVSLVAISIVIANIGPTLVALFG